eukprot:CAMPEP_0201545572 /NCGR_PEP_ID=MMETSP0173_2-20130828/2042_1 /ASSEMBLY_ACC=CAM_ASM_000268 /TAXON_ID=218659 /ORGANISM="Vexillifera sp., Strain DIVA3 564/2" /LENGTH=351 /DNA_ID=CAMNT_0047953997 /DNA_START=235 /DNA_END=1290 /DNA_ORIENTATION=+
MAFMDEYISTMKLMRANQPLGKDSFTLVDTIGTGTFGRVFLVRCKSTKKYFAMKVMKKHDIVRLKQVEHIENERSLLASVIHPFIVPIYGAFQDNQHLYMILEYIVGGEVFSHLRRAGRFSAEVSRFYAAEIVLAFEHLHAQDIVYRDLKPENLLLDAKGHLKITDFGFAKRVTDRTWTLCGTPEYLAPEIIQSKGHGKAVDWWAFGVFLFEMLAGYPPFFDDNPFGIYEKILASKVHFPPHFDQNVKDLIRRLLVPDQSRRLGNLRGGAEDIKRHKWFKGVDWNAVLQRKVVAPIIPRYKKEGDTSNFEEYDEDWDWGPDEVGQFGNLFSTFTDVQPTSSSSSTSRKSSK